MANKPTKEQLEALRNEIRMARKYNDEELKPRMIEGIGRYSGKHVPRTGESWDIILNEIYPVIQNHLPAIFFRNPRAFLRPRTKTYIVSERDPVTGKMNKVVKDSASSASTQEAIVNYQMVEIDYKKETRRALLDALIFPHGILWHGYKGDFGMNQEASIHSKKDRVFVKRISPMRLLKDPSVSYEYMDEGRWVGRTEDMRLEDLMEDPDMEVSKELKGFTGFGEKVGTMTAVEKGMVFRNGADSAAITNKSLIDFTEDVFKKSLASKFVAVHEIFMRPTKKEQKEGIKGWIILMCDEQDEPLRVSEWKIKAEGFPAKLLQFNPIPERMLGMADIDAYSSIADQKNVITNLQIRNAQENTKVWVGINKAGADEEDIEKIRIGENTIILFDDDTPIGQRMQVQSPGGQASSELYIIDQRIQRNLDEKAGVTDLQKGFLQSGEESATSARIRAAGSSVRAMYRQDIMADFLKDSIRYLTQLNKQFLPFDQAVRIMGTLDINWSENPSLEEIQAEVDIELDVVSMLPGNPEDEVRKLQGTLNMAIQAISDPIVRRKINEEGKNINITPLIERILMRQRIYEPDVFRKITPEESQGYVSVAEVRAAKANVQSALAGQVNIPSPPEMGQDHVARIEIYSTILDLIKDFGPTPTSQIIGQLIQAHQAFLQEEMSKEAKPGMKVGE